MGINSKCIFEFQAELNSTAQLDCIIKGGSNSCSWKRNEIAIKIQGRYLYLANQVDQNKGNCSIVITNVTDIDRVKWECEKSVGDQPQQNIAEKCDQTVIKSNNFQKTVSPASDKETVANFTTYSTCNSTSTDCGPVSAPLSPIVLTFGVLIGVVGLVVLIASLVGIYYMFVSRRQVRRPVLQRISTGIQLQPLTPRRIGNGPNGCVISSSFPDGSIGELYDDVISLQPPFHQYEKTSRRQHRHHRRRRRQDLSTSMEHLPGNEYRQQKRLKKSTKYKDKSRRQKRSANGSISTAVTPTNNTRNNPNSRQLLSQNNNRYISDERLNHKNEHIDISNITANNWSTNTSETMLSEDCVRSLNPPPLPVRHYLRLNASFDSHLMKRRHQMSQMPMRQRHSSSTALSHHSRALYKQNPLPHPPQSIDINPFVQQQNVTVPVIVHTEANWSLPPSPPPPLPIPHSTKNKAPKTCRFNNQLYENNCSKSEQSKSENKLGTSDSFEHSLYGNSESIKCNETLTSRTQTAFSTVTTRKKPVLSKRIKRTS
ncbi:hypothetical protein CHUAL_003625 [Chamberlinius hualienensis]